MIYQKSCSAVAILLSSACLAATPSQPVTGGQTPSSAANPPARAVLVELFTSEGCSTCPPADELLRRIDGTRTEEGTLIVGLSEHVTYWDHDGWKDPFGSEAATDRQNDYAHKFQLESVYTPQMVVDGEAQFSGVDTKALAAAVEKAETEQRGPALTIDAASADGSAVKAQVSITGNFPSRGAEMFAVVAEDETTLHVLRGENKGKTLAHASVARTFLKVGKLHAAGQRSLQIKFPEPAAQPGTKRHLVVWLQEPDAGRVLCVSTRPF